MKSGTRDKTEGTVKDLKGHTKEAIGKATNKPGMQADGLRDQIEGHTQKARGELKKQVGR